MPVIFDVNDAIYNRHGINYETLHHFDSIGLVNFDNVGGHIVTIIGRPALAGYYTERFVFKAAPEINIGIGKNAIHEGGTRTGADLRQPSG